MHLAIDARTILLDFWWQIGTTNPPNNSVDKNNAKQEGIKMANKTFQYSTTPRGSAGSDPREDPLLT